MVELKNVLSYKLIKTQAKEMFGLRRDELVKFKKNGYSSKDLKHLEEFINILYYAGYLEVHYIPKIGDLCYFWNGNDKMDSLIKGGPFIAKYEGVEGHKFVAEGSDMIFTYCQLVSDE